MNNFSFYSWLVSHVNHWNEDAPGQDLSENSHIASEALEVWLYRSVLLTSHGNDVQFHDLKTPSQEPAALCCPPTGCNNRAARSLLTETQQPQKEQTAWGLECPCHHQRDLWCAAVAAQPQLVLEQLCPVPGFPKEGTGLTKRWVMPKYQVAHTHTALGVLGPLVSAPS